jgi:hypothetical protein
MPRTRVIWPTGAPWFGDAGARLFELETPIETVGCCLTL